MSTAPLRHSPSLNSGSRSKSSGLSSLSRRMRVLWSYRRLYWLSASAYRGRSWHRDISMNRRRSAAPARMRNKSSGAKNTVCSTSLSAAPFLAFTPLTVMLRRLLRLSRMSVTNSRWREKICPTSSASCLSKPISSRSPWARGLLPQLRYTMASSRLVLPWAFSP